MIDYLIIAMIAAQTIYLRHLLMMKRGVKAYLRNAENVDTATGAIQEPGRQLIQVLRQNPGMGLAEALRKMKDDA